MSDSPVSEQETKPKPRGSRKWARRLFFTLAVLLVVAVITLFAGRAYFRATGECDLKAEMARLDAEDPGWRWDDLEAARTKAAPPEAEDSARVVREVHALIPKEWNDWVKESKGAAQFGQEPGPPPLNRLQSLEGLAGNEDLEKATRNARNRGLALRNYPRGYHKVVVGDLPLVESLEETQSTRVVADLMKIDAVIAAQSGDSVRGLQAARAILNVGRSIGDEPALLSSLVRFAEGFIAAETAMRVLALKDSKDALAELTLLQAAVLAEVDEPILLNGLRGECALMNRFFDGMNNGTISIDKMARTAKSKAGPEDRAVFYFRSAFLPEDQRRYLRLMSELIAATKQPFSEQIAIAEKIERDLFANRDPRYLWHNLFFPATVKVLYANARHRAELLSAAALIACERFRLTRGHWPESLAEIPKDLLPAIPTDPFTGEPMKFAKLPDGITVYSLPPKDLTDPLGKKRLTNPLGGSELGWRLYDPPQRSLPPLPKPKPEVLEKTDEP